MPYLCAQETAIIRMVQENYDRDATNLFGDLSACKNVCSKVVKCFEIATQNDYLRHSHYGMMPLLFDSLRVPHLLRVGKSFVT